MSDPMQHFQGGGMQTAIGRKTASRIWAAPGVNIRIGEGEGGAVVSGTSYATPFVTAAAALLMEYGIVQGNDPFLYGEKVKAYLHAGARQLPGYDIWPNDQVGWGALCVSESLPGE